MSLDLSIVLITYNRSSYLRRTLTALSQSVFKDCEIWVLDNASTDDSAQVCQEYSSKFSNFHTVTHRTNIGGNSNILRAYEYGSRYYKWILCDDDELIFDSVGDLIQALGEKKCDLIRVAELGVVAEERGKVSSLGDLLQDPQSMSFYSFGFVPGIIFKSESVLPHVQHGYLNIQTRYPQLFVLMKAFAMNALVYTMLNPLLQRGGAGGGMGSEILIYQILSLDALPTQRSRQVALGWRSKRQNLLRYIFGYGFLVMSDLRAGRSRRQICQIILKTISIAPSLTGKLILLLNTVFILVPVGLVYRVIKGEKIDIIPYPERGSI